MPIRLVLASSVALLLSAVSGASVLPSAGAAQAPAVEVAKLDRTCGTPEPSADEVERLGTALRRYLEEGGARVGGGTIKLAFHVITAGGEGEVSSEQIADQIRELNRGYAGTGYRFELASVDRSENPQWFKMTPGTGKEKSAKQALAIDPAHRLNVYTCSPGQDILGWAYFPFSAPEDHWIHGVVVHYGSLPGGSIPRYNLGRTMVHEVGHYLGLFHTFQGGCVAPGDHVDDTPFEASPAFGCPIGRNSCPDPGEDPIHNFMDYSDDECLTEFTAGQDDRVDAILPVYRPSLFVAPVARAVTRPEIAPESGELSDRTRAIEFRGAFPNPFRGETAIRFTLPNSQHVTLRIYNVAGQLVQTLMDAQLPAGDHSAMFSGRGLPSGMYFLALQVGRTQMSRSVILVR